MPSAIAGGYVAEPEPVDTQSFFPFMPRLFATGLAGDDTTGKLEGLLPIYGGNSRVLFIDGQGKYGDDDAWFAGVGMGYRHMLNGYYLGGYFFGDAGTSKNDHTYWVLNPGAEFLSSVWDAHLNGYFPLGDKTRSQSRGLGDFRFEDHAQFGRVVERL